MGLPFIGRKQELLPQLQENLEPHDSRVYDKLDPQGIRRGNYNQRWKVIENL